MTQGIPPREARWVQRTRPKIFAATDSQESGSPTTRGTMASKRRNGAEDESTPRSVLPPPPNSQRPTLQVPAINANVENIRELLNQGPSPTTSEWPETPASDPLQDGTDWRPTPPLSSSPTSQDGEQPRSPSYAESMQDGSFTWVVRDRSSDAESPPTSNSTTLRSAGVMRASREGPMTGTCSKT